MSDPLESQKRKQQQQRCLSLNANTRTENVLPRVNLQVQRLADGEGVRGTLILP